MKKSLLFFTILALGVVPSYATTKTVGASGADFTSIQAAIDSFTDAELTDGTPDVVEIIDAGEYDEQVVIGGLIADPESKYQEGSNYLGDAIELALSQDPFTLRGGDPNNRPKINPVTEGLPYGVFTNDPTDNFVATFSYLGKDITVENVEILQSSLIHDDQYGINGQAGNMVFKNVLFAHDGDKMPGEAIINFNNAVDIAGMGIDNSYTFIDCTFDAAVNGARNESVDTIYFHGYSQGDADGAGVNIEDVAVNMTFENCSFLNGDVASMIRGRAQANNISIKSCFVSGNNHGLRASGKGTFSVQDSIFYNNMQNGGDADSDVGALETVGRNGFTPELTVQNSIFVDNLSADYDSLAGVIGLEYRAAAIRIRNDGTDPDITIENCTFVNNPIAIRFADSAGRPRNASINNNIFQNCNSAVLTADDLNDSYFNAADPVEALVVNGVNNIFDNNFVIVEDNDKLPNVSLEGTEAAVTFDNASIDMDDPFAGPPYLVASGAPAGVGADLGGTTSVQDFMLY
ncbi:MAG: hypothetical protein ACP5I1_10355 [Candidatus Hinthialibacter sp.]